MGRSDSAAGRPTWNEKPRVTFPEVSVGVRREKLLSWKGAWAASNGTKRDSETIAIELSKRASGIVEASAKGVSWCGKSQDATFEEVRGRRRAAWRAVLQSTNGGGVSRRVGE